MATTGLADVQNQIKTFWSPIFDDKLKEDTLLPSLVSKDYIGSIQAQGDTVKVSAIDNVAASRKNVNDSDADSYSASKLSMTQVSVSADTIIEAGVIISDLAMLQSQLGAQNSKIRTALFDALERELNTFLYEKVAPSASSPDMIENGVSDLNATQLGTARIKASQQYWGNSERYLLCDPTYYQDLLNASTFTSSDYGAGDAPMIGGRFGLRRMGFNIFEDNSTGIREVSPTTNTQDTALLFVPDWLMFVRQVGVTFKLSDLHGQQKRGFFLSAEMIVGAELGIEGNVKHQTIYNT